MLTIKSMIKVVLVSLFFNQGECFLMDDEDKQHATYNPRFKPSLDWARLTPALVISLPLPQEQNVNKTK